MSSLFPKICQRAGPACKLTRWRVMRRTEIHPIEEKLGMKIRPPDGKKRQKMRTKMAGTKQVPHFSEMRRTRIHLKAEKRKEYGHRPWLGERRPAENVC